MGRHGGGEKEGTKGTTGVLGRGGGRGRAGVGRGGEGRREEDDQGRRARAAGASGRALPLSPGTRLSLRRSPSRFLFLAQPPARPATARRALAPLLPHSPPPACIARARATLIIFTLAFAPTFTPPGPPTRPPALRRHLRSQMNKTMDMDGKKGSYNSDVWTTDARVRDIVQKGLMQLVWSVVGGGVVKRGERGNTLSARP